MLPKKLFVAVTLLLLSMRSSAQKLQTLVHQPPNGAGIGFLLTDGTAMFQGNGCSDWWKRAARCLSAAIPTNRSVGIVTANGSRASFRDARYRGMGVC